MIEKNYINTMVLNHPSMLKGINLDPQPEYGGWPESAASPREQYEVLVGGMELYCYDVIRGFPSLDGGDAAELAKQTVALVRTLTTPDAWESVEHHMRYGGSTAQQAVAEVLGVEVGADGSVVSVGRASENAP